MFKSHNYITTPIYYVNGSPHIGHAYTSAAADSLARWLRLDKNHSVFFATGTDEHGQKIEKAAKDAGKNVKLFCDEVADEFKELAKALALSNDYFVRTTDESHKKAAQKFWSKLLQNGFIYKGKYEGWYAIRDEAFYSQKEIINGKAPTGADVEWKSEECYFFKLSAFEPVLLELYKQNPSMIKPASRLNEVVSFVASGLNDLCVSRSNFSWGIKAPNDPEHVMYVWLDALTNYLSLLGYEDGENYNKFWLSDSAFKLHLVGKDILRFHAVYWPAFLIAQSISLAELESGKYNLNSLQKNLPSQIFAHGWWTKDGEKMSKSLGNVVDPFDIVKTYGLDKFRYFMLASASFGGDANFTIEDFIAKTNADLVNNFGNLVQRTLTIIHKNFNGLLELDAKPELDDDFKYLLNTNLQAELNPHIQNLAFEKALSSVMLYSSKANEFIDKQAPWKLLKEDTQKAKQVLYTLCIAIRQIGDCLACFCPEFYAKFNNFFTEFNAEPKMPLVIKTTAPSILFDRI